MKQRISSGILFTLCVLVGSWSHADTAIYKWVDKDGVVSFSQTPPNDRQASEVSTIIVRDMPPTEQRAANRMLLNMRAMEQASSASRQKRMKQADQAVDMALEQLQIAERNLQEGAIPTGYDRVGMTNGRARLRAGYFERVSDLQNEVDKARHALNHAYWARDQIAPE